MCLVDSWFVGFLVVVDERELELGREMRPYVMVDARVSDKSVDWLMCVGLDCAQNVGRTGRQSRKSRPSQSRYLGRKDEWLRGNGTGQAVRQ